MSAQPTQEQRDTAHRYISLLLERYESAPADQRGIYMGALRSAALILELRVHGDPWKAAEHLRNLADDLEAGNPPQSLN